MTTSARSSSLYRIWRRWWFHLGLLMVLLPLAYLKSYIDLQAMLLQAADQNMRSVQAQVGPWALTIQDLETEEPYIHPKEGLVKAFRIVPCEACAKQIRAVFVSLKRPGSTEYGAAAEGNPYRLFVEMKIGRNPSPEDQIWITAEGWDGSRHQVSFPLASISPTTATWLERNK
ncbi:MAG: hypothetical protein QM744_16660 [Mesorhizobium sp.]